MGYRRPLPEASQPGEDQCRPLLDVIADLRATGLPVASEAASVLWDMSCQIRRQIGRIHQLEIVCEMYREESAETLAKLYKAMRP